MLSSYFYFVCFFFFQAEDGIRDRDVTGVQTCALPISFTAPDPPRRLPPVRRRSTRRRGSQTSRLSRGVSRRGWGRAIRWRPPSVPSEQSCRGRDTRDRRAGGRPPLTPCCGRPGSPRGGTRSASPSDRGCPAGCCPWVCPGSDHTVRWPPAY